jgi:hypothetical protein
MSNDIHIIVLVEGNAGCIIITCMRQDNAAASWHVDETLSIVRTTGVAGTCEVLRQHDGICKGW